MQIPSHVAQAPASSDLRALDGRSVVEFFPELCRLRQEIAAVRFASYKREPGLSKRLSNMLSTEDNRLGDTAEKIYKDHGIPFWDTFFSIVMKQGKTPGRFVDTALHHAHDPFVQTYVFLRNEASCEHIRSIIQQLPPGHGLVACSRVLLASGKIAHIPMLDFLCPTLVQNRDAIRRMLSLAGQREGILVNSGHSYHFYGTCLLPTEDWIKFMAKALLSAPITDPRYIAHRLIDGECRLRITDSRDGLIPTIVDAFPINT
jgi:hypothetical protein